MVATRVSVDDINLGIRPSPPQDKRARSTSPVKQRRPTQDWSSLARSSNGSLDRLLLTSSLSHDQLMLYSNLDIAGRLHISKSDYVIPIPFQIQFPPRLTSSSSEEASPRGSPKLIFTGHTYEPVTPNMPTSPTFEETFSISRPLSPVKPPSVISSRKKVSEFVKKTHSDHLDQLSMIEEKSNSGNSRSSSRKSKELPKIPNLVQEDMKEAGDSIANASKLDSSSNHEIPVSMSKPSTPNRRKSPPLDFQAPEEPMQKNTSQDRVQEQQKKTSTTPKILPTLKPQDAAKRSPEACAKSKGYKSSLEAILPQRRMPHSTAIQHNLSQAQTPELRIDKRTFSDESQVSSVSSFSSFGDVLNFTHAYMLSPNSKGEVRVSKELVDYMTEEKAVRSSAESQNPSPVKEPLPKLELAQPGPSVEPSVQPADKAHNDYEGRGQGFQFGGLKSNSEMPKTEKSIMSASQRISPPDVTGSPADVESETAPLVILRQSTSKDENCDTGAPEDNIGAGIGFHFPNNTSNATNSTEARIRSRTPKLRTRGTSRTSFFSEGKIEIPDLNDEFFRAGDFGGHSANEVEPLGVPSSGAREHAKALLGDRSFDSDSDSSFNSQFSKLQAKKDESKALPESKSLTTLSSLSSPVRHSRHRSMYNIDFDYQSISTPVRKQHSRSKSTACAGSTSSSFADFHTKKSSQHSPGRLHARHYSMNASKDYPIREEDEDLHIRVSEPPKKVSYAVDFKTGDAAPEPVPSFHIQSPSQEYYQNYQHPREPNVVPPSKKYAQDDAESSSSYKSSKTGRDSASTVPTEDNSVVIDLTEEKYDVCMINRNDSTTSYRSTIEQTRDGKNVEVVIVEEDEEGDDVDDRDDLLSIYSRYMTNWEDKNRARGRQFPTFAKNMGVHRRSSNRSATSEASDALGQSWAASSESHFQVKSLASIKRQLTYLPKAEVLDTKASSIAHRTKPAPEAITANAFQDTNYFDYSIGNSYDFKSYMSQQNHM